MADGRFVSYCRVSTAQQGSSGLGLEAQKQTITDYLNGGTWELIAEFVEVESGKGKDRPQLQAALNRCKLTGSTLLVAKLDRLSRDLHFITSLEKAGVDFTVCDFPTANKFTIHIFAALAEYERELISERTKSALKAVKARGQALGSPEHLTPEARAKGAVAGTQANKVKADSFAMLVVPHLNQYKQQGQNLSQIATSLNLDGTLTPRGEKGTWTAQTVKNVMERFNQIVTRNAFGTTH